MTKQRDFLEKAAKPKSRVLSTEVASSQTDPLFYSALQMLPNPDPVLRKLGRAQDAYEAIAYDAHVMGEIRSQHGGLLKHEWKLIAGGDESADIAALELCQKIFDRAPTTNGSWSNLIWNTFQAVYKGYSVSEVIWQKEDNFIVPCRVEDKPTRRFVFGSEKELRLLSKLNTSEGEPVDTFKFLLTRHMPDHDNPYGKALFSACFWPYTFKHNGYRWFSKFMQRYGQPSPVGRYPQGTSDAEQRKLLLSLEKMIEDNAIAIPIGTEIELLETKIGAHNPHDSFINLCNREISKVLTSQTLASEVTEAGSRSTADVQKGRQDDNSEADREMIARTFQQLVDWTCALNMPNAQPPKWQWHDEKEVSESEAKTMKVITTMIPVKSDDIYDRFQLTKPEPGDEVIFTGGQSVEADDDSEPGDGRRASDFSEGESDDLERLADQGVAKSKQSFEELLAAVYNYAESAEDLDEIEAGLPDLLDSVDPKDFARALMDTKVIANAKGADDAT